MVGNDVDLVVSKVVDNGTPIEGDTITYTISVTNNGPAQATNVVLTDVLPAGVTYVSDTGAGAYVDGTGIWTIGSINNTENATIDIVATVDVGTSGDTITNTVTNVSLDQNDDDTTPDDLDEDIVVGNDVDLVVAKVVDNGTPNEGDTVTYTITVTNNGPAQATNVVLTDVLPAGVTYVSDTGAGAYVDGTGIWTIGSINDAANATIDIIATVDVGTRGDTITNTVTNVSLDQNDVNTTPDDLDEDIVVNNPLIVITKSDNAPADGVYDTVGESIIYTIEVTNTGNVTLSNVLVTDANADTIVPAALGSIDPGVTVTVTATHTLTQGDIDLGSVTNTASVEGQAPDTTVVNDDSDDPDTAIPDDPTVTIVDQTPELTLVKFAEPAADGDYDSLDEVITYTLTVINSGTVTLTDVVVTDVNADAGSILPALIATMAPGESVTVMASHTITQTDLDTGFVTNQAEVTGDDPNNVPVTDLSDDPTTPDPDDATITSTELITDGELTVTKSTANPEFTAVGDVLNYDIVVTNTGTVTITDIIVTDDNATIISGSPIATLLPGDSVTVLATRTIVQADIVAGQVINTAIASGEGPSGDPLNPDDNVMNTSDDPNNPTDIDPDGDGIPNDPTVSFLDSDGDGVPNAEDLDDDNDGITELEENNGNPAVDTDNDGIIDTQDLDADGDGILDVYESGVDVTTLSVDPEGRILSTVGVDGIPDTVQDDPDTGTVNYPILDTDGDGEDDFQDVDDDGDDILTVDENPDPNEDGNPDDALDSNLDDVPDYLDEGGFNEIITDDTIAVFNTISPNGDGLNDKLVIQGLSETTGNVLKIYNRWGVEVFEASDYGNNDNFFRGYSNGRVTISDTNKLPTGTYYYVFEYTVIATGNSKSKAGYLYIN